MTLIGIRGTDLLVALIVVSLFWSATLAARPRPVISEDRELKEIDLGVWDCRDRLPGTAKTDDGIERNQLKNRSVIDLTNLKTPSVETDGFLQMVAAFDAKTKGLRRNELNSALQRELEALERKIVSVTGYLVIAYAGPPETTNCGSTDFHDWHLELFEQPLDHAPEIGDPTPIICEISPRTQNAIFRSGARLQAMASFIRAPDMAIEPTDHPARRVRITGYLLWDDEHNGAADIGDTISTKAANGFHQPWRRTAWEIHPAIKIEALDLTSPLPRLSPPPPESSPTASNSAATQIPTPAAASPTPRAQFVTLTAPIKIKILYGETVIPRGTKLRVISHDAQNVTVSYLDGTYAIPISSTDFRQ